MARTGSQALRGFFRISPVMRKRFRRFREMRRAWFSFWALIVLFTLSLCAEILCNRNPLYVRYRGHSYFPVFHAVPPAVFGMGNEISRVDYKKLARSPQFAGDSGNFMVFPPIPYGPNEIMDPADIPIPDRVFLELLPEPRVAWIDVTADFTIVRAVDAGALFGVPDAGVRGRKLSERCRIPQELHLAVANRLANRPDPRRDIACAGRGRPGGGVVICHLAAYRPRRRPRRSVRILLREPPRATRRRVIPFAPSGQPDGPRAKAAWAALPAAIRDRLLPLVKQRFETIVEDRHVTFDGSAWRVVFDKEEVRFPFRPTRGHWLGLDSAGRDVAARMLYGLRTSLTFGLVLVVCSTFLGILAGAVQGYAGGKIDITGQRLIEIWAALPFLYIMILLGSVYGRSFALLIFCYGLFNWIGISYYVRAEFLRLRRQPFVEAARCLGLPARKIIFRHILPNALVPVITLLPFSLVGAIGSLAALDYLGFGLPPPTASWGELLQEAQQFRWAWWLILYPSLGLFTVMLLGVFIGEGARNAFDPRKYSRME